MLWVADNDISATRILDLEFTFQDFSGYNIYHYKQNILLIFLFNANQGTRFIKVHFKSKSSPHTAYNNSGFFGSWNLPFEIIGCVGVGLEFKVVFE